MDHAILINMQGIGFQVSEIPDDEFIEEEAARVCEQKNVLSEHLYHKPL
jgi:hypothetical protein